MKLIIEIDEQHFELLQMAVMNGMGDNAQKIIAQGIPLPKGHGRLIDVDNVKSYFSDKEGNDFTVFHFYDAIENAPTIIEADKEQTE